MIKHLVKVHIIRLGDKVVEPTETISTGSLGSWFSSGSWWFTKRKSYWNIWTRRVQGKQPLLFHAIAEAQKAGGVCAFIDAEHALDVNMQRYRSWYR